jgi:hypothetical protein
MISRSETRVQSRASCLDVDEGLTALIPYLVANADREH